MVPVITRNRVKIAAVTVIAVLVSACSQPSASESSLPSAPTEVAPTTQVTVVEPSPTVVIPATPVPTPSLADDDLVGVVELAPGERVVDAYGNAVAVHGVTRLPLELIGIDVPVFDDRSTMLTGDLAVLDIGWCSGSEPGAGTIEFDLVDDPDQALTVAASPDAPFAMVSPGFAIPESGECARGWLPVTAFSPAADVARYLLNARAQDGSVQRFLFQWPVETSAPDPDTMLRLGQVVTFNDGPLTETSVELLGWAELLDEPSEIDGARMVGVQLRVCTETEDWPEFGLSVQGWNVLAPTDLADRLGADPLAALTGTCNEGWLEFAVPLGVAPSGVFVSDGRDPVDGFAAFTLEGAAIAPPDAES